ncbi:glycosyltransferase family 2 protein [Denitromonas iodatirespirans]|uniref:Glycosyltransferase family 2 protein n=1 Tax=Denitromonas iodatirespirans TaxID=2795389 RepID=A0A944D8Q9_DENI1|nr:glycosyltransferase family A protein [Denitromonas iodatirespirans]MBT0960586.1 glycosyltransferase family 2 protein [Denitromonas iodatirespirans]
MTRFTVVIPTRNRPMEFDRALRSVLAQAGPRFEVIAIIDGATEADLAAYRQLDAAADPRVRLHPLPPRAAGHGPSFSRNTGAALACGEYLAFLDDDDLWDDPQHLQRCDTSLRASASAVDLYLSDQQAVFHDGRQPSEALWIRGAERFACGPADAAGSRPIDADALLKLPSFAHLNCSIYRRSFFDELGGLDESLRYEEDRDIFLRAIDAADGILYNPIVVARHHIPNRQGADNASTMVGALEKKLYQLRIFDKAILGARSASIRRYAQRAKGYELKHIAQILAQAGRIGDALFYMKESLMISFSLKALAWTLWLALRALTGHARHESTSPA